MCGLSGASWPRPSAAASRSPANPWNRSSRPRHGPGPTRAGRRRALAADGHVDRLGQLYLDDSLTRLCDHMGKCERIKSTVFPYTYGFLVTCLLWVFALLLPLATPSRCAVSIDIGASTPSRCVGL